jgi:hypothetical protein
VSIFTATGTIELVIGEPLPGDLGAAVIIDGLTFVPLRFVADALGVNVEWDDDARAVNIAI